MIIDIVKNLFEVAWLFLKIPIYILTPFIAVFILVILFWIWYYQTIEKIERKTGKHYKVKKRNIIKRLFYDLPKQYAKDLAERDPEYFRHNGIIVFTGRQGRGKTVALVEQTLNYQMEYPKCKVIGNLDYLYQDDELNHWKMLTDYKNGIQGVVVQMDEMQNWFSSNQSKDFPPEMLTVITQNRKNRRIILGTSQVFNRLAKPLREQATEVRECHTFLGCLTIVIKKEPFLDSEGNVEKMKFRGMYCFVHNKTIREAYDTYKTIEKLSESGFKPLNEQLGNDNTITIKAEGKKKGFFKK